MADETKKPASGEARDRQEIDREMRDREERDKQVRERERRDEEMHARERRERERFRERERERDRERDSDRDRLRHVERERERDEPSPYWGPAQVKSDLSRLAYASARAGTDIFVGITEVIGNLVGNFKDSMLPGGPGYRRRRSDDDRDYGAGGPRRGYGRSSDAMDDVRSAVRETADVVARSGEDFSRYYDNSIYEERDERGGRGQRSGGQTEPPEKGRG